MLYREQSLAYNAGTQATNETRTYNNANRWFQLFKNGELTATYTYNAQGQRTRKVLGSDAATAVTTIYHYDQQGQLIAETNEAGESQKEYLYNGMSPVAQIDGSATNNSDTESIHYLHTDHLYTPRLATNQAGGVSWRWEGEGFGASEAEELGVRVNLRFPGQYFDEETQLHYNYFRYYDPSLGRYLKADSIGMLEDYSDPQLQVAIISGVLEEIAFSNSTLNHLYGYADQNPTLFFDFHGLRNRGGGTRSSGSRSLFRWKSRFDQCQNDIMVASFFATGGAVGLIVRGAGAAAAATSTVSGPLFALGNALCPQDPKDPCEK